MMYYGLLFNLLLGWFSEVLVSIFHVPVYIFFFQIREALHLKWNHGLVSNREWVYLRAWSLNSLNKWIFGFENEYIQNWVSWVFCILYIYCRSILDRSYANDIFDMFFEPSSQFDRLSKFHCCTGLSSLSLIMCQPMSGHKINCDHGPGILNG